MGLWLKRKYICVQESASDRYRRPLECLALAMESVWREESREQVEEKKSAKNSGQTVLQR